MLQQKERQANLLTEIRLSVYITIVSPYHRFPFLSLSYPFTSSFISFPLTCLKYFREEPSRHYTRTCVVIVRLTISCKNAIFIGSIHWALRLREAMRDLQLVMGN